MKLSPQKSPRSLWICRRDSCDLLSALPRPGCIASANRVKHLEGKLWELRLMGRDGTARALYVTAIGQRVVVVRAFVKKTQKTPRAEIEIALQRAKDIT